MNWRHPVVQVVVGAGGGVVVLGLFVLLLIAMGEGDAVDFLAFGTLFFGVLVWALLDKCLARRSR